MSTSEVFLVSDEASLIREELERMVLDPGYVTNSFYTTLQDDNLSFVEKHMSLLKLTPQAKVF